MKLIKLTAFSFLFVSALISFSSCEKSNETKKSNRYEKNDIPMTGAQVIPNSTSAALGKLSVGYIKGTGVLGYKITWSGLTGNPTGIGVYGLAPVGFAVSPTAPIQTISTTGLTNNGSYSGTLTVDGVVVKEENVINGMYYVMIRTAANPAGEIRGQVKFQ